MTETGNSIQAQAGAIQALAAAFDREVQSNRITGLAQASAFIATWAAAVAALVPTQVEPTPGVAGRLRTDSTWDGSEPAPGRVVLDKDGDSWTNVPHCGWVYHYESYEKPPTHGDTWYHVQEFAPLTLLQES